MPAARRYSNLFRTLTARIAVALVVLLISGLLAATLRLAGRSASVHAGTGSPSGTSRISGGVATIG